MNEEQPKVELPSKDDWKWLGKNAVYFAIILFILYLLDQNKESLINIGLGILFIGWGWAYANAWWIGSIIILVALLRFLKDLIYNSVHTAAYQATLKALIDWNKEMEEREVIDSSTNDF